MAPWSRWWVAMWAVITLTLVPLAFVLPLRAWSIVALFAFGVPELISLRRSRDPYPPLTSVIVRWSPRWLTMAAIGALVGGAVYVWRHELDHPAVLVPICFVGAWMWDHFTDNYERRRP